MDTVKCCNCEFKGTDENLIAFEDERGAGWGCPNCKTDEYLMDLEPEVE